MKTSARGIEDLILSEGLRLKAYKDSGGVFTVGVGHTSAAGPPSVVGGMVITEAEAKEILARDLAKFEARVNKVFPNGLPQHAFDGAVSFDFNTGSINSASWPTHYKAGRLDSAERNLKLWNKVKGTVIPGLTTRRAHEADLIFRGKYRSSPTSPPVTPPAPAEPVLRKGDGIAPRDNPALIKHVLEAQTLLVAAGFSPGSRDGKFGLVTEAKVIAFQRSRGLEPDGVIGPKTWAALRSPNPAVAVMGIGDEPQPKETAMNREVVVPVKSPWASKINWTSVIGIIAMLGAMFGLDLDAQTQASIVAGIVAVQGVVTMVLRTFFTKTVTPEVADKVQP